MDKLAIIKAEFTNVLKVFEASPAMQHILSGDMTIQHYKSYLRQTYHYTKDNPQIQALATVYFHGSDREFVRMFYKHAISEIGHDELALNDLQLLGENIDHVRIENPLPATVALNAFVFYQIYNRNPIGYLGYLFFLEFLPTSSGAGYMQLLEKASVPKAAMTFLLEHTNVDIYHNRLMEKYLEGLVITEADMQAVIYTMRGTGQLYADMLQSAFMQAEQQIDWGIDTLEAARYDATRTINQELAA
jgi:pyrroloquinoline quinone (PQQ) biosynthesis protein C